MRISQVSLQLSAEDLNAILVEFVPDAPVRVTAIEPDAIKGQIRLLFWHVDFIARPAVGLDSEVSIEISAHKMWAIPAAIVGRQLKEAIKDAPPGVDVIRQSLQVRLPELLRPLGIQLAITQFCALDGILQVTVENVSVPALKTLLQQTASVD